MECLIQKPAPTKRARVIWIKVESCGALLRKLLVFIRSYLKSAQSVFNFGYLSSGHSVFTWTRMLRFVVIFEAKRGPRAKTFGKHYFRWNELIGMFSADFKRRNYSLFLSIIPFLCLSPCLCPLIFFSHPFLCLTYRHPFSLTTAKVVGCPRERLEYVSYCW